MAQPDSAPPSRPPVPGAAVDLNDAEFAELDGLLADIPEPLEPLDAVMLDGFLAAVIVQPSLIEAERWLPHVFDAGGHRWGEAEPGPEQTRARELILRRHAAVNRSLAEFGGFEPLILEPGDEAEDEAEAEGATAADEAASDDSPADARPADGASGTGLDPVTRAMLPWVAGFEFAASVFPGLYELDDDAISSTLARLYRFLPAEDDDDRAVTDLVVRERPLDSLDAAIEEVIACIGELYDLTAPVRYQVETVRRSAPKVGRNDACPCGSGRKYKHCHGKG